MRTQDKEAEEELTGGKNYTKKAKKSPESGRSTA